MVMLDAFKSKFTRWAAFGGRSSPRIFGQTRNYATVWCRGELDQKNENAMRGFHEVKRANDLPPGELMNIQGKTKSGAIHLFQMAFRILQWK